jgi:hypothetical protein
LIVLARLKGPDMLHTTFQTETMRETRTPVRLPDRRDSAVFPGWGPKV